MNLHEYQAKALLAQYSIPVPAGKPAFSPREALLAAEELGGDGWVVKAQIHAGGRGKARGVRKVKGRGAGAGRRPAFRVPFGDNPDWTPRVSRWTGCLSKPLAPLRASFTSPASWTVVSSAWCSLPRPRAAWRSRSWPRATRKKFCALWPIRSPACRGYQCRGIAFALGLEDEQVGQFTQLMSSLFHLFKARDLALVEINPLAVTQAGELLALDAKIRWMTTRCFASRRLRNRTTRRNRTRKNTSAQSIGLNYIALDGNIGCMVNGAGLAMATMDLIKLHGGAPANFLDVGGGTTADKVAEAFKIIVSDASVKAILVNIFGGIVRCDLIAEGIIKAVQEIGVSIPVVVRLEGTNVEKGRALLKQSGLKIIAADSLTDAAKPSRCLR